VTTCDAHIFAKSDVRQFVEAKKDVSRNFKLIYLDKTFFPLISKLKVGLGYDYAVRSGRIMERMPKFRHLKEDIEALEILYRLRTTALEQALQRRPSMPLSAASPYWLGY
jgi:hypothetical protein